MRICTDALCRLPYLQHFNHDSDAMSSAEKRRPPTEVQTVIHPLNSLARGRVGPPTSNQKHKNAEISSALFAVSVSGP